MKKPRKQQPRLPPPVPPELDAVCACRVLALPDSPDIFGVFTPSGFCTYTGDEADALDVCEGENVTRMHKKWMRVLADWHGQGWVTADDVGLLFALERAVQWGRIERSPPGTPAFAIQHFAVGKEPGFEVRQLLSAVRMLCDQAGISLRQFRERADAFADGRDPAKMDGLFERVVAACHGSLN